MTLYWIAEVHTPTTQLTTTLGKAIAWQLLLQWVQLSRAEQGSKRGEKASFQLLIPPRLPSIEIPGIPTIYKYDQVFELSDYSKTHFLTLSNKPKFNTGSAYDTANLR